MQKKPKNPELVAQHKETFELCKLHIEECEMMEKRKALDANAEARVDLLGKAGRDDFYAKGGGNGELSIPSLRLTGANR